MIERPVERRVPLPNGLGRRVELLGALAVVLFAVVVFRLWYLQVLTGRRDVAIASANVTRNVAIPAPRGKILDSSGRVLAGVRSAAVAAVVCDELPSSRSTRANLYGRLASVLKLPASQVVKTVGSCDSYAPVTIEADIPSAALIYLAEHKTEFPGVVEQQTEIRYYPYDTVGAQVLGYVGQLSEQEESDATFKSVPAGNVVGQSGLEYEYDPYLRGTDGVKKVQVDAAGIPTGEVKTIAPTPGEDLKTSIDLPLEQEGMKAMNVAMGLSHEDGYPGTAAAFVALDPNNGDVLAMGSVPSFNSNVLSQPFISDSEYAGQEDAPVDAFDNRAIAPAAYPTGSTFKPITALAGLESGLITPSTLLGGTGAGGCLDVSGESFCNSGDADYGANNLAYALEVSEDTYFYQLGELANQQGGNVIQHVAKMLGLGKLTGLDLPFASTGYVPSAQSDAQIDRDYVAEFCRHGKHGPFCPDGPFPVWTVGQDVQLATGQGQLQVAPIQMAVVYSALENGGYIVTPHIGQQILSPAGDVLESLPSAKPRAIPEAYRQYIPDILPGLHLAAQGASGTSDDVFGSFPITVYGKTGTAQTNNDPHDDQSWYDCFVKDGKRSIVVVVTVQQGGFGDEAAAPAARLILAKWFGKSEAVLHGTSTTF